MAINVDDELHNGLVEIMDNHTMEVKKKYQENSFHHLFCNQQVTNPKQRRWHPMIIWWCLHLCMLSGSAYDALRRVLILPSDRTLRDYMHYIKAGVQVDVINQLMSEANIDSLEDWQKYVALVFDEVKIKEGIVYDKHDCKIVGFVDLGPVNNTLLNFESSLSDPEPTTPSWPVAKQMLIVMVRGVFIKLHFPYAHYPTSGITADLLFPLAWEVIRTLECAGFKVISITGDGASQNRKFFRMHQLASESTSTVTHKVRNPYSKEDWNLFFFVDIPHLLKTVRNCWSNSFGHSHSRALWVSRVHNKCSVYTYGYYCGQINDQHISWEHLRRLYKRRSSGLTLLPKLTLEHLNLNSYSRMRVNLAAQVRHIPSTHNLTYTLTNRC